MFAGFFISRTYCIIRKKYILPLNSKTNAQKNKITVVVTSEQKLVMKVKKDAAKKQNQ